MAPPENVMMLMKQYLSSMSKRIDDLIAKTQELEAQANENSQNQKAEIGELAEKMEKLVASQEDSHTLLEKARDEWKKRSEEIEANLDGFITYEAITEIQNKLDKQIETLRDEKLDRADFQEFEDSTFKPLKELFQENEGSLEPSPSFADFAAAQARTSSQQPEEEFTPPPEEATSEVPPPPPPFEPRRSEKKKKKWL